MHFKIAQGEHFGIIGIRDWARATPDGILNRFDGNYCRVR